MMKYIICAISLFFAPRLNSQQLPEVKPSFHVDGIKIYWNKNLPYYIHISDDKQNTVQLKSDQKKYSNPAYFDTYGFNYIRTKYAVDTVTKVKAEPEQEILWPVFVDGVAPTTKISLKSKSEYKIGNTRYFTKDLIIGFSAADKESGLKETYYIINDSAWIKFDKDFTINPLDSFKIKFFSVDNVGNSEKVKEFKYDADSYDIKYGIDNKPPKSEIVGLYKDKYISSSVPLIIKSTDDKVGVFEVKYQIDGGEPMIYKEAIKLELTEGDHEITYWATDKIFNEEQKKKKQIFNKTTKPVVMLQANAYYSTESLMYIKDTTIFKIVAKDYTAIKNITYSLGGKFIKYKPFNVSGCATLKYFATDTLNVQSDISVIQVCVDEEPPVLEFKLGSSFTRGDTTYTNDKDLVIKSIDAKSGVKKEVIRSNGQIQSNSIALEASKSYSAIDTVTDNLGNITIGKIIIKSDQKAPEIEIKFSLPQNLDGSYPIGTDIFIAVTDESKIKEFLIYLDGSKTNSQVKSGKGTHIIRIVSIDFFNQQNIRELSYRIQ